MNGWGEAASKFFLHDRIEKAPISSLFKGCLGKDVGHAIRAKFFGLTSAGFSVSEGEFFNKFSVLKEKP